MTADAVRRTDFYAPLIPDTLNSHRFFTYHSIIPLRQRTEAALMLDLIMLVIGLGFFALSLAYAYACDRL
jgi:hypothetical protein